MTEHGQGEHGHSHSHDAADITGARLLFIILLNFFITAAEAAGGIIAGSLSLVSDSLHNFSDGLSFVISYYAIKISKKQSDYKRTFGYKRATIMAALINAVVLIGISLFLLREAYDKFVSPEPINGSVIIWVALVGLAANMLGVLLLKKSSRKDLNLKSSYIHLIADTLSSVGVVAGGVLIFFYKIYWVDPLLTVLISVYILKESFGILKDAVNILMQGTPGHIDIRRIAEELGKVEGVVNVHHVHVWGINEKDICFEAHVNVVDMPVSETKALSDAFERILKDKFGIRHITIQFEYECCGGVGLINTAKD